MRVIFIFLMIIVSSCDPPKEVQNLPYVPSKKQCLANLVRLQTASQLEKEKGLVLFGTAGQMMGQIKMLGLSFQYYKEIEIEEARELLLTAALSLLNAINSNELIRIYLNNYPFEPRNIEIKIFLFKPNGTQFDLDKLHYVKMTNGILEYVIRSSANNFYETIYTETYEEATQKLGRAVGF